MTTRSTSKQGRTPAGKSLKTGGKDQTKGEKQPTNVLEIVPGKFNETDWLTLLENDDTEDFIADIFESIWTETSKQIQQIYIRRQLLPFTLKITENAISNVIQWAFLERDEPKPTSGTFWTGDSEPIPCTMDNWGEGVVPACREERPQSNEESPMLIAERPSTAPAFVPSLETIDQIQRPSTGSSVSSSTRSPRSSDQNKKLLKIEQEQSIRTDSDDRTLNQKEFLTEPTITTQSTFEQKPYFHDVLVIQTQPPKLEPLSDLYYPPRADTHSSSYHSTPLTSTTKYRQKFTTKTSSQVDSDTLASTTNITGTTTTKSFKKATDSKVFDDHHIEEVISKTPLAAHSMLKSILNRPPGHRELELDDYGNVVAITKIDPDKLPPKSIRVKCDVVKRKKSATDTRLPLVKPSQHIKSDRSEQKLASIKLAIPEQSTDVGDLIQPMPGVLYEDARLKKGDPRRYQTGMSKYANFYDETRPLRPIAPRGDLAILKTANDLLRQSKDDDSDDDTGRDPQIPKLHRLARIPPILSGSSTTSA